MTKAKKKAVPKMKEVVEPTYYATLTEEQFDALERLTWDNPIDELKRITEDGDSSMIELGFKIGEVHAKLREVFEKIETITTEIKPEEEYNLDEWDEENYDNDEDSENE